MFKNVYPNLAMQDYNIIQYLSKRSHPDNRLTDAASTLTQTGSEVGEPARDSKAPQSKETTLVRL